MKNSVLKEFMHRIMETGAKAVKVRRGRIEIKRFNAKAQSEKEGRTGNYGKTLFAS